MPPTAPPEVAVYWDAKAGRYRDSQTGRFLSIDAEGTPGDRMPVTSSVLASIGYDTEAKVLELEFHSGAVYQYHGVPLSIWEGLRGAGSHGKYFAHSIRGHFAYSRL